MGTRIWKLIQIRVIASYREEHRDQIKARVPGVCITEDRIWNWE